MMTSSITKCVVMVLVAVNVCAACAQSTVRDLANIADAYTDSSREKREQAAAPDHIKEIFALAKKSAEEDFNVNFCGFFAGMSRHDTLALAEYYKLKDGEYSIVAAPGKAVSRLWFSLKGVRRITKGGNTLDELAQAVANRVGNLKRDYDTKEYEHKTIDGVVVRFGNKGLSIQNDGVASQAPLATAEAAQKDKADVVAAEEEAARKRREAAEEAARKKRIAKEALSSLIKDMITIPGKNFKMGKYEVTQAQWQAVMGENPAEFKGDYNPVENVSWDDCKKFLEKLNDIPEVKASGLTFRLPTEVEWEYVCRAGATGDYCRLADGSEITADTLGKVAWYNTNGEGKTHPVGQKEQNAFGLYDMHGNVWEWCCEKINEVGAPLGLVIKGGSWYYYSGIYGATWRYVAKECEVSFQYGRRWLSYDQRCGYVGFRLVAQTKEDLEAAIRAEKEAAEEKESAEETVTLTEEERAAKEVAERGKKAVEEAMRREEAAKREFEERRKEERRKKGRRKH